MAKSILRIVLKVSLIRKLKILNILLLMENLNINTMKIIKKYRPKIDIVISKDRGIYDAFNKGMSLSSGKFICVNSDDILTKNALQIIKKYRKEI